jgi:glycosyltransferase involved in cell wall biosynthesis
MPTVSVVVPNYNHARFLPQRIESILRQTFQDFELILLDDGSVDESRSILARYVDNPRVRIKFNAVNSGSAFKQWNEGIRLAQGKYVWIAESDDYADERLLERLTAVLDRNPTVTFAYCRSRRAAEDGRLDGFADYYLHDLDPHRWTTDFFADGHEECRNYFVCANPVPNASAVVFRKCVYEDVGGADERLRMCGDWKLWAALALKGKIAYLGEPLNYYRFHDASVRSLSRKSALDVVEFLQVIRWILDQVTPTHAVLRKLCQRQAGFWVPAVMSTHVPFALKLTILRNVRAIDRHPIRRAVRPALQIFRRNAAAVWSSVWSALTAART